MKEKITTIRSYNANMTVHRHSRFSLYVWAFTLTALALLLGGCESRTTIAVQPDGSISGYANVNADALIMSFAQIDCETLDSMISSQAGDLLGEGGATYTLSDTSTSNTMDCTLEFDSVNSVASTPFLTETDTSYILSLQRGFIPEDKLRSVKLANPDFSLSVSMPGSIISAPGAEISGNTASYNNIDVLTQGINVEGEKVTPKGTEATQAPSVAAHSSHSKQNEPQLNILHWGLIVIGVLFVLVLGIGIARHRKRTRS